MKKILRNALLMCSLVGFCDNSLSLEHNLGNDTGGKNSLTDIQIQIQQKLDATPDFVVFSSKELENMTPEQRADIMQRAKAYKEESERKLSIAKEVKIDQYPSYTLKVQNADFISELFNQFQFAVQSGKNRATKQITSQEDFIKNIKCNYGFFILEEGFRPEGAKYLKEIAISRLSLSMFFNKNHEVVIYLMLKSTLLKNRLVLDECKKIEDLKPFFDNTFADNGYLYRLFKEIYTQRMKQLSNVYNIKAD